jgi:hypothetical protein
MSAIWKKELDALVEQTMVFAKSVEANSIAKRTAEPAMLAAKKALEEGSNPPLQRFGPMTWKLSERDEIKQRVADFKAHQRKMQIEREDFFLQTMCRTRARIGNSAKPLEY